MFEKYFLKKEAEFESKQREWEIKTYGMSLRQYASERWAEKTFEEYQKPLFIKQLFKG